MDQLFAVQHAWLIPLLPLIGAVLAGFLGAKMLKGASHWPIWLAVGASAALSLSLLFGTVGLWRAGATHLWASPAATHWFTWIEAGQAPHLFRADAGAWIDPLSIVMLCVVTCVGFLITVFAAGYMKGESGYFRFFAYLGLFIFAMTVLVMANNFVMMYLGWEGVGLCSYLLIGYYYERPSAREAAKKAFLVNRVGDFGFSLGIMLLFLAFGTVSFFGDGLGDRGVLHMASAEVARSAFQDTALKWAPFLLMLGAFGKSAQFPLYVWLPDAMEGPTPVSALIHAATMVTAGVYMIVRCGMLFVGNDAAMTAVAFIGALTAIMAAAIAMRQFDLKKVFAYSTISQLGYMFVGVGVLAPVAGVFHLVTHAFFKSLLFLAAGMVMHAMSGELDMRKLSGLKRVLPWTNRFMLVGCAALAGFPFLSGFFSKDEIVGDAYDHNPMLGVLMLFTNFLTAYYTFRLYFRVFQGPQVVPQPPPGDAHDSHGHDDGHGGHDHSAGHSHEPWVMVLPLIVLMIGAITAGYLNWPHRHASLGPFLGASPSLQQPYDLAQHNGMDAAPEAFGQSEKMVAGGAAGERWHFTLLMGVSALLALAGIALAYRLHLSDRAAADRLAVRFAPMARVLDAKFYVDEIYQAALVEPLRRLGTFFYAVDRLAIDGLAWVIGFLPRSVGFVLGLTTERGYLQGYAATMVFGIAVILLVVLFS